jgi:hypothetical protein
MPAVCRGGAGPDGRRRRRHTGAREGARRRAGGRRRRRAPHPHASAWPHVSHSHFYVSAGVAAGDGLAGPRELMFLGPPENKDPVMLFGSLCKD